MTKPTHQQIEKLITEVLLPFCHVTRDIALPRGERRLENDAEHSWSLAFLAASLAPQIDPKLDVGKICQYAIVHDLVEVYAGDTPVHGPKEQLLSKTQREHDALLKLTKEFSFMPWISSTITEYESRETDEAKFVYAIDKYLPVFFDYLDQARHFREQAMTHETYKEKMTEHRRKAHTHSEVGKYYDAVRELIDAHPEYFHTLPE